MSTDFIGSTSQALLNSVSQSIFPNIKSKLGGTSHLTQPASLTVTWAVQTAPVFDLSGNGPGFRVNLSLSLTITPDGGKPDTVYPDATASAKASISGSGTLSFFVTDLTFSTQDSFVKAVLDAKKNDIAETVNGLLSSLTIPLGPINGITLAGYAAGVSSGVAYAAGGLSTPVSINQHLNVGSGFSIALSEALMQQAVKTLWWDKVDKTFSPGSGVTVHLNGYSASVSNGSLNLRLNLSGTYELGPATWDIDIDTVTATLSLSVDAERNIKITGGNVSRPSVNISPANFWAYVASIGASIIGEIVVLILDKVVGGAIQSSINSNLNQTLFTVPVLNGTFDGVNLTVTPVDLSIGGSGSQIVLSGTAVAH